MHIGYQFQTFEKEEVTHSQLVKYAGASGDFNPIHTVVPFAKQVGLGGVIAHGMLIMGFVGQAIGTWIPLQSLAKFSVRFQTITRPEERISVTGVVIDETEDRWVCEALAQSGDEVKAKAQFEVKKIVA
ncbi:MaoC/PaaZ C-terminal domain-containing protein [Sporosarcina soli]|uniref:MaoC/PaaZ C-terminal domain-containing protein n=1 Tax=Sporosarcina soli TaxID=334736 RepID=A0ABW0TEZ7_9BACL